MNLLHFIPVSIPMVIFFFSNPLLSSSSRTQAPIPTPSLEQITNRIDTLFRSQTSHSLVEMTIQTPYWQRTLKMNTWSEGLKKTFLTILEPKKDAGISTLRIESEMWNYFPNINKTLKVPPSMMMGSWMGSDFTNDDLVKESGLTKDYHSKFLHPFPVGTIVIESTAKTSTITLWTKVISTLRKNDLIPTEQVFYDEKGRKGRTLLLKEIKEFSGRIIPSILEMIPENKPNQKTVVRYLDVEFDVPMDQNVFTLKNLQRRH